MIHAFTILLFFPVQCEGKMRSACTSTASYYRTGIGLKARGAPDRGSQWTGLSEQTQQVKTSMDNCYIRVYQSAFT